MIKKIKWGYHWNLLFLTQKKRISRPFGIYTYKEFIYHHYPYLHGLKVVFEIPIKLQDWRKTQPEQHKVKRV